MSTKVLILISMTALIRVGVTQNEDFCDSFAENNFEVNFVLDNKYDKSLFLFIDQNYWKISNGSDGLNLNDTKSRFVKNWFGSENLTTFDLSFPLSSSRLTRMSGLFEKTGDKYRILWAPLELDNNQEIIAIDTNNTFITDVDLQSDFNPRISFGRTNQITFIEQKTTATNPIKYLRSIRRFKVVDPTHEPLNITNDLISWLKMEMTQRNIPFGADDTIANNVESPRKMMALSSENIHLYQEEESITYCFANTILYFGRDPPECQQTRVLINCSHTLGSFTRRTPMPFPSLTDPESVGGNESVSDGDFCESFAENNYEVNYALNVDSKYKTFLFIGHKYWTIINRPEIVKFNGTQSQTINYWFGEQYLTAFEIRTALTTGGTPQVLCGLLEKSENTKHKILWAPIHYGEGIQIGTISDWGTTFDLDFDFHPTVSNVNGDKIHFIDQKLNDSNPEEYLRTLRVFKFKNVMDYENKTLETVNELIPQLINDNIRIESLESVVNSLPSYRKLITITFRGTRLYRERKTITYCSSAKILQNSLYSFIRGSPECGETQILIDCSHNSGVPQTQSPPPTSPTQRDSRPTLQSGDTTDYDIGDMTTDQYGEDTVSIDKDDEDTATNTYEETTDSTSETEFEGLSPNDLNPMLPNGFYTTSEEEVDSVSIKDITSTTAEPEESNIWIVFVILAIVLCIIGAAFFLSWYTNIEKEPQKGSTIGEEPTVRSRD